MVVRIDDDLIDDLRIYAALDTSKGVTSCTKWINRALRVAIEERKALTSQGTGERA